MTDKKSKSDFQKNLFLNLILNVLSIWKLKRQREEHDEYGPKFEMKDVCQRMAIK